MDNVDLLGSGVITSVDGKKTGIKYSGHLFKKGDVRSSKFEKGSILLDVKEFKDDKVLAYHSAQLLNEDEFDENVLSGDHYLILEKSLAFSRVSPLDDFGIE